MKIKIHVTREILERSAMCPGLTDDNGVEVRTNCAVALSVIEIFPNAEVYQFGMTFTRKEISPLDSLAGRGYGIYWGRTNPIAHFIGRFDALAFEERRLMPEQSFEIDVPSEVIEKIGIGEVYKILSESKTLELVNP